MTSVRAPSSEEQETRVSDWNIACTKANIGAMYKLTERRLTPFEWTPAILAELYLIHFYIY